MYFIFEQTSINPYTGQLQTGVYVSKQGGGTDQYTGNSYKTTEEAAKLLKAAGVSYQVVVDTISSGNDRG